MRLQTGASCSILWGAFHVTAMTTLAAIPPARRAGLLIRPLGNGGEHVVKDAASGEYFNLGPEEAFLLLELDGRRGAGAILRAFEQQFGSPLTEADLDAFVDL